MSFLSVCKVHYERVKLGEIRIGGGTLRTTQVRHREPCQLCPRKRKPLSSAQRAMMVRMLSSWRWPYDGRKAHGWRQTLWSLKRKGLVDLLTETEERTSGWVLTNTGQKVALELDSESTSRLRHLNL